MLFGLNTVSVLTLIDVPVCFPLLLQTESTHKSGYYRLGGVRQKQPFLQLFAHHSLLCLLPFSGFRERRQRHKTKGEQTEGEWNRQRTERQRGSEREYMVDDSRERRGPLQKADPSQFNHPNWKCTSQRAARWQLSLNCAGMFVRMSNNWYHKDKLWFICQF